MKSIERKFFHHTNAYLNMGLIFIYWLRSLSAFHWGFMIREYSYVYFPVTIYLIPKVNRISELQSFVRDFHVSHRILWALQTCFISFVWQASCRTYCASLYDMFHHLVSWTCKQKIECKSQNTFSLLVCRLDILNLHQTYCASHFYVHIRNISMAWKKCLDKW